MKALWYVLVFVLGGAIGVFVGGIGGGTLGVATGMLAGGVTGTELGVCTAIEVAKREGLLTAAQQQGLLEATASHLRTEFKDLVEQANLSESLPLDAETCKKLMADMKTRS